MCIFRSVASKLARSEGGGGGGGIGYRAGNKLIGVVVPQH